MSHTIAKSLETLKSFNRLYRHPYYCKVRKNTLRSYYSSLSSTSLIKLFSSLRSYNTLCYTPTNDFQTPNENHESLDFSETDSKFHINPNKSSYFFEAEPQFNQNPNKSSYFCETEPQFNQNPDKSSYFWEAEPQFNPNPNRSSYCFETEPQCNQNLNKSWYFSEAIPQFNQNLKKSWYFSGTKPDPIVNYDNQQSLQGNRNVSPAQPDEDGRLRGTIEELDGFCKERKLKEAVEVLGLLERNNVLVDLNRYILLMNECGETQALEEGRKVHGSLVRSLPSSIDVWICNKILEMYAKCGSMEDAYKMFDKMSLRNVTCWDTMITWFAKNGHGEDAIDMFTEFKRIGLKPDSQMFFGVFTACSVVGDMKEGLLHFESMSKHYDIVPSLDRYRSVVDMLGSAGYLNEALQFIEKMPMEPSVEIWEALLNNCRVHGDTELGDRCLELIELLVPTRLDEHTKAGLIPIKPSDIAKEKALEIRTKVGELRAGDICHPEDKRLYGQLRCLKQPMIEAGYIPETDVYLDVDQESKEEALLSHGERLALSLHLLTTPARSQVRIIINIRVCRDCHAALKIISKIVGRLIIVRDSTRIHHFNNGAYSWKRVNE